MRTNRSAGNRTKHELRELETVIRSHETHETHETTETGSKHDGQERQKPHANGLSSRHTDIKVMANDIKVRAAEYEQAHASFINKDTNSHVKIRPVILSLGTMMKCRQMLEAMT